MPTLTCFRLPGTRTPWHVGLRHARGVRTCLGLHYPTWWAAWRMRRRLQALGLPWEKPVCAWTNEERAAWEGVAQEAVVPTHI